MFIARIDDSSSSSPLSPTTRASGTDSEFGNFKSGFESDFGADAEYGQFPFQPAPAPYPRKSPNLKACVVVPTYRPDTPHPHSDRYLHRAPVSPPGLSTVSKTSSDMVAPHVRDCEDAYLCGLLVVLSVLCAIFGASCMLIVITINRL